LRDDPFALASRLRRRERDSCAVYEAAREPGTFDETVKHALVMDSTAAAQPVALPAL